MAIENMLKRLRETNESLPELFLGILIWGILCQAIGVWFVKMKLSYSIGLWIGIVLAGCLAYHMAWGLNRSLDLDEKTAINIASKYGMIRYAIVLIAMGILIMTNFASPLSAFLGVMGLKVAAYVQPFTHKIFRR